MRLRYARAGGGSRRGRTAAARGSLRAGTRRSTCSRAASAAPTSRSSRRAVRRHRARPRGRRASGGRRLALDHHRPCGECARCRAGHESTCAQFAAPTIVPGGFAERVAQPAASSCRIRSTTFAGRWSSRSRACCAAPSASARSRARRRQRLRRTALRSGARAARRRRVRDRLRSGAAGRAPDGPVGAAIVCARGAGACARRREPGGTVLVFADAGELPADVVYRRELTVVGSRSATPAQCARPRRSCPSSTCRTGGAAARALRRRARALHEPASA